MINNLSANAGDMGSIPDLGISSEELRMPQRMHSSHASGELSPCTTTTESVLLSPGTTATEACAP